MKKCHCLERVHQAGQGSCGHLVTASLGEAKEISTSQNEGSTATFSGLSRADAFGDIYVFSLAGHEATGNALTFALYLLAGHPEVQAWVQEEIDSVYDDSNKSTYELFPRMKHCLAVIVRYGLRVPMSPNAFSHMSVADALLTGWRL